MPPSNALKSGDLIKFLACSETLALKLTFIWLGDQVMLISREYTFNFKSLDYLEIYNYHQSVVKQNILINRLATF